MFTLHPQLESDALFVTDLELSRVLLMNNALFPWLILVPRVENATELVELLEPDRIRLMEEICKASTTLLTLFKPDKLNVATLGNKVPQLHVHVIARFTADPAWPNPVWGGASKPYDDATGRITELAEWLWAS